MNWKKLTIGITLVNALAWIMLEVWGKRYAGTNIAGGAAFLIVLHLIGYYIIYINSVVPTKVPEVKSTPQNCTNHDWHKHIYSDIKEQCIRCGAERGLSKQAKT